MRFSHKPQQESHYDDHFFPRQFKRVMLIILIRSHYWKKYEDNFSFTLYENIDLLINDKIIIVINSNTI